jgi:hypothetical protein
MSRRKRKPMSEARRQELRDLWTPERRAEASTRAKEQYADWAADHPERAVLVASVWAGVEAGTIERLACGECFRPMHPLYDWDAMVMTGWRCRARHATA